MNETKLGCLPCVGAACAPFLWSWPWRGAPRRSQLLQLGGLRARAVGGAGLCERALAAVDGLATLLLADAVNVVARTVALKPSVKMTLQELWKNEEPAHKSVQAWQAAKYA